MSRKRRNRKKAAFKGQLLFGVGILLIAAFSYTIIELNKGIIERDPESMCRTDGEISRDTAVVIDATDSFNQSQALLVKKEIKKAIEESLVDERFTLYVLNEVLGENPDRLSVCNPGDGSKKSELTSNKRRLLKKWQTLFYDKFVNSVDELVGDHVASQSPIMEMIKLVSVKTMYDSSAEQKRIILVSDMLHHTSGYSQYRTASNFNIFKDSAYALEQKPHLSDVNVSILYLIRGKDNKRQNRGHINFWENYILSGGGQISRVKTIN